MEKNGKSVQEDPDCQELIKTIPFGANVKSGKAAVPPKPVSNVVLESKSEAHELYGLLKETLTAYPQDPIILEIGQEKIPQSIKSAVTGEGKFWLSLDPKPNVSNRSSFTITFDNGRIVTFRAGVCTTRKHQEKSSFFVQVQHVGREWTSFRVLGLDPPVNTAVGLLKEKSKEKGQKRDRAEKDVGEQEGGEEGNVLMEDSKEADHQKRQGLKKLLHSIEEVVKPIINVSETGETRPNSLYRLLAYHLGSESTEKVHVQLIEGKISDTLRRNGRGLFWLSLDPSEGIRDDNRVTCSVEIDRRKFQFEAGAEYQVKDDTKSSYHIRVQNQSPDWNEFLLVDRRCVGVANRKVPEKRARVEENNDGAGDEISDAERDEPSSGKELLSTMLQTPDEILKKLLLKTRIDLVEGEDPIPEKIRTGSKTIWLCLDFSSTFDPESIRLFQFYAGGRKYRFKASASIRRATLAASIFVQIQSLKYWTYFEVIDIKVHEGDASQVASIKAKKTVKKRPRPAVVIDPADKDLALEVFNRFRTAEGKIRKAELQIQSGAIRDQHRGNSNNGTCSTFWIALDYSGLNYYPEDIITFASTIDGEGGPVFKACLSKQHGGTMKCGKLLLKLICTNGDQYSSFGVVKAEDHRPNAAITEKGKEEEEEMEEEAFVQVELYDSENDEEAKEAKNNGISEGSENQKRLKVTENVDAENELPAIQAEIKNWGIGDWVDTQIEKRVAEFQASHDAAVRVKNERIRALETEKAAAADFEKSARQRENDAKMQLEKLSLELSIAKGHVTIAEQVARLAQLENKQASMIAPEKTIDVSAYAVEKQKLEESLKALQAEYAAAAKDKEEYMKQKGIAEAAYSQLSQHAQALDQEVDRLKEELKHANAEWKKTETYRIGVCDTLEKERIIHRSTQASLIAARAAAQAVAQPPAVPDNIHEDALKMYVGQNSEQLKREAERAAMAEARVKIRETMWDRIAADEYYEIIADSPELSGSFESAYRMTRDAQETAYRNP